MPPHTATRAPDGLAHCSGRIRYAEAAESGGVGRVDIVQNRRLDRRAAADSADARPDAVREDTLQSGIAGGQSRGLDRHAWRRAAAICDGRERQSARRVRRIEHRAAEDRDFPRHFRRSADQQAGWASRVSFRNSHCSW